MCILSLKHNFDHFCFVFRFEKFKLRNHTSDEDSDVSTQYKLYHCTCLLKKVWLERVSLGISNGQGMEYTS